MSAKKIGRPRKLSGEMRLVQITVRMDPADKVLLMDLAVIYGSVSDAMAVAIRTLHVALTDDERAAIKVVRKSRGMPA